MSETPIHKKAWLVYLGKIILLTLAYYVAGKISFSLSFAPNDIILLWLPAGIALAALLRYGVDLWPGVFFGSLFANASHAALPHTTLVIIALGNMLACLSSTYILKTWLHFDPGMERVRDVLAFLVVGAIWNPLISAVFGVAGLLLANQISLSLFFYNWWVWAINDSMSILLLTPFLLAWSAAHWVKWRRSVVLEGSIVFLLLAVVSRAVYGGWLNLDMSAPLSFAPLPFIIWTALRLGKLGATIMTLFGSGFAMWGTLLGYGPFIVANDHVNFLYLSGFTMTTAVTALLMTAMVNERSRAQKEQAQTEARYRDMINNVPIGIARTTPQGDILDCNLALVKMLQYPNKESLLATNASSFYPTLEDRWQRLSVMDRGDTLLDEILIKRYDGVPIWVSLSARATRNPDDGRVYYEVAAQDVTRRKQAEEELKQRWDENIRLMLTLEKKVQDRTRQLSTLYRIARQATYEQHIERFFEAALEILLEALQSPFGAIVLCQQPEEKPRLVAVKTTLPETDVAPKILSETSPWLQLLGRETTLVIEDVPMDGFIPADLNKPGQYVFLGAPIRNNRRTIGSLGVLHNTHVSEYSQEDIVLMETVCDHLGTAIENARLRQQTERAAIAEERQRLARELHDSVTQSIYSATLMADAVQQLSACGKTERAGHFLDELCRTTRHALKEMRLLIYELRPSPLEQLGLEQALRQRLEMVERHAGIEGKIFYRQPLPLAPAIEEGLFRIAQEALNNVTRHSNASSVSLRMIGKDDYVTLEIADNGIGFEPAKTQSQGGLGLTNMRERARKMGGTLEIFSKPGSGTKVKVRVKVS
ncbi:MAG: PAS domain S-box protein [Anaerolineae bacterium]|nr:PAS domain S-box protein [Anaerolineae bacterium]